MGTVAGEIQVEAGLIHIVRAPIHEVLDRGAMQPRDFSVEEEPHDSFIQQILSLIWQFLQGLLELLQLVRGALTGNNELGVALKKNDDLGHAPRRTSKQQGLAQRPPSAPAAAPLPFPGTLTPILSPTPVLPLFTVGTKAKAQQQLAPQHHNHQTQQQQGAGGIHHGPLTPYHHQKQQQQQGEAQQVEESLPPHPQNHHCTNHLTDHNTHHHRGRSLAHHQQQQPQQQLHHVRHIYHKHSTRPTHNHPHPHHHLLLHQQQQRYNQPCDSQYTHLSIHHQQQQQQQGGGEEEVRPAPHLLPPLPPQSSLLSPTSSIWEEAGEGEPGGPQTDVPWPTPRGPPPPLETPPLSAHLASSTPFLKQGHWGCEQPGQLVPLSQHSVGAESAQGGWGAEFGGGEGMNQQAGEAWPCFDSPAYDVPAPGLQPCSHRPSPCRPNPTQFPSPVVQPQAAGSAQRCAHHAEQAEQQGPHGCDSEVWGADPEAGVPHPPARLDAGGERGEAAVPDPMQGLPVGTGGLPQRVSKQGEGGTASGGSLQPVPPLFPPPLGCPQAPFHELEMGPLVGEGGFARVYRARWRGREVAVKLLTPESLAKPSAVDEFRRELFVLSSLDPHPHLLRLLGACTTPPHLALVSQYCPGGSLYALLHSPQVQLGWAEVVGLCLGVARGMAFLHSREVLHRDLKSGNLLVDGQGRVVLADFGLSRVAAQAGPMTGGLGTYQWMAPEVLGHQRYSQKADVYSFAMVMWECAARKVPYAGMDGVQAALAVMNRGLRPEVPPPTPPAFARLMRSCWAPTPDQRPGFDYVVAALEGMAGEMGAAEVVHGE